MKTYKAKERKKIGTVYTWGEVDRAWKSGELGNFERFKYIKVR